MPGRPIFRRADNSGAAATLIRMNATPPLGRAFASIFRAAAAVFTVPISVEKVRAEFNIANPPIARVSMPVGTGEMRGA